MSAHVYVIVDRKEFVHCNQMSSESEVFSPSSQISFLSTLICLCSLHWCLPYYLWFGLSGCESVIMLKMPHFDSLKALFFIPLLSFPLISSYAWHLFLAGRREMYHIYVGHTNIKKILYVTWPILLTHPHTDTHLCACLYKIKYEGFCYAHKRRHWKYPNTLITLAKEVILSSHFVCHPDYGKSTGPIFMKLGGRV